MKLEQSRAEETMLLKKKNVLGLTICGQEHEMQILQQLSEHFNNLSKKNKIDADLDVESDFSIGNVSAVLSDDPENETEQERKIRLGEMTPFGTVLQANQISAKESQVSKYLKQQEKLRKNFINKNARTANIESTPSASRVIQKYRKLSKKIPLRTETVQSNKIKTVDSLLSDEVPLNYNESSGSEYVPSDNESNPSELEIDDIPLKRSRTTRRKKKSAELFSDDSESDTLPNEKHFKMKVPKERDDGDEEEYERRIHEYEKSCDTNRIFFYEFDNNNFKIPLNVWSILYNYQKVGVQWLWELHQQGVGGILADEMGLGKTIQLIVFLSGLYYSKLKNKYNCFCGLGPSIVVCPTTLMYQWVKEFHIWLPPIRVAILHACGSFSGRKSNLIRDIYRCRGVLITSYAGMVQHSDEILRYNWHYSILDEGHKIRNPNAKITLSVKQLKTPHRIILSGSPLQNNLEELWSLFDFIYPGKLGALPLFQAQFAVPITHGGYSNASDTEIQIAYKCATVLKEFISPYLLRRSKVDVKSHIELPEKNEQVLFCQLTDVQRNLYKAYIESGEVHRILEGQAQIFVGIINLRKICNHPDLYSGGQKLLIHDDKNDVLEEDHYGFWKKSGKMIVLETLLKMWYRQKHKVLLFTQSRQMLNILENFVNFRSYKYLKLDGSTYIGSRQPLIDKFNTNSEYFIMLLTTKVGGLGVNLTGADRVVIFDPDWNPATDTQARERAWRIGQRQNVTIYRLISVGTVEEKMYHRQIFKQFLTNKVLKDPKQRRFFKSNDLFELFTLKESSEEGSTETGAIFAGIGSEVNMNILNLKKKLKKKQLKKQQDKKLSLQFSENKIEKMKQIAQRISQKLSQQVSASKRQCEQNRPTTLIEKTDANEEQTMIKAVGENEEDRLSKKYLQTEEIEARANKRPSLSISSNIRNAADKCEYSDFAVSINALEKFHKKKHRKSNFEGEYVPYLKFSKKSEIKTENDKNVKAVEDEYVLKKLFSKAGICSALQHDTIMEGGPPDFALVEREAERIAQHAINELKRNQEQCFPAHTGIPNWTGKHGIRPKTNKSSPNVLSASDVLDRLKKRNSLAEVSSSEKQILTDLRNFISSEGGTAATDRIIETFQNQLPASATPLFKCMLNKICSFYRGPDKKGYWTLKTEFLH